jgi:hypothetical protein
VSDDPVQGLEKLAELHQRGELSDAQFEQAKRELLDHSATTPVTRRPDPAPSALAVPAVTDPAPSLPQDAGWRPRRAGSSLSGGSKLALIAVVIVGFVFGIAALIVAEVAPSSAQWTKGFVCAGGQQLITNGGVVHSNGGSAQGATHFRCAPTGQPVTGLELLSLPEKTGSVLGLSFLLGFLIGGVLTLISAMIIRSRSRAQTARG